MTAYGSQKEHLTQLLSNLKHLKKQNKNTLNREIDKFVIILKQQLKISNNKIREKLLNEFKAKEKIETLENEIKIRKEISGLLFQKLGTSKNQSKKIIKKSNKDHFLCKKTIKTIKPTSFKKAEKLKKIIRILKTEKKLINVIHQQELNQKNDVIIENQCLKEKQYLYESLLNFILQKMDDLKFDKKKDHFEFLITFKNFKVPMKDIFKVSSYLKRFNQTCDFLFQSKKICNKVAASKILEQEKEQIDKKELGLNDLIDKRISDEANKITTGKCLRTFDFSENFENKYQTLHHFGIEHNSDLTQPKHHEYQNKKLQDDDFNDKKFEQNCRFT